MKILTISGSSRSDSANTRLLLGIPAFFPDHRFLHFPQIDQLPLFKAESDTHPWAEAVIAWRTAVREADAVIFSIPEYIHNMPALIKNALEWVTSSGELMGKKVLAITFTPHAPRGEKAMQSLLWSLQALDARVVAQLPLYQNEIQFEGDGRILENEGAALLLEGIRLLFY